MAKNIPWNSRITWYYYTDKHTAYYSEDDFEAEAAQMRSLGIDIVLLSNKTHFRFNFYPYWDRIVETLGKLIRGFHKQGIKVVEHHSCSLLHAPLTEQEWEKKADRILHTNDDESSTTGWEKVKDWVTSDSEIDGVRVSSLLQIHGGTHELAPTQYNTRIVCYNNEDYRRIYFKHLEDIYALGVDGIMTDDVQFFADGNSCACPVCRKLYREQTGYTLPESTQEWNENFFGNFDDPRYVAFDQFRRNSAIRFQRDVDAHFRSLGLNLLRPNYISDEILTNYSAYPFSNCADLWDVMFQENVYNSIIRYSWPHYACEAVHRYAFASQNDIPSMSMFYCKTVSDMYFSFALCLSWGQLFNPAFDRTKDMVDAERYIRSFEKKYPELVYEQKKKSDIGVFFSMKTRDLIANARSCSMNGVMTWLQAAYFTQKNPDFVLEEHTLEDWMKFKAIVLPHVFMMSEEEIKMAGNYAKSGGTLIFVDLCGKKTPEGFDRTASDIQKLLGCKTRFRVIPEKSDKVVINDKTIDEMTYFLAYDNTEAIAKIGNDTVIAREDFGDGEILFIGSKTNLLPFHSNVSMVSDKTSTMFGTGVTHEYSADILRNTIGKILDMYIREPVGSTIPEEYTLSIYESADGRHTIAHILNIKNTIAKEKGLRVSMYDSVEQFAGDGSASYNIPFNITFACAYKPEIVRLLSPEWSVTKGLTEQNTSFVYKNGYVSIQINENTFKGYLMVDAIK